MTTSLDLDNIPITIKYARTRRTAIKIAPFCPVCITAPFNTQIEHIICLLKEKMQWIRLNREKMKSIEEQTLHANSTVEKLDVKASRSKLITRIYQLAQTHGFEYNRLEIREQKTLWGSCSANNNINLNLRLAWLPEKLIDYVIMHELMHTRIKNHSPAFWRALEIFIPDAKMLRRQLRAYRYLHCV